MDGKSNFPIALEPNGVPIVQKRDLHYACRETVSCSSLHRLQKNSRVNTGMCWGRLGQCGPRSNCISIARELLTHGDSRCYPTPTESDTHNVRAPNLFLTNFSVNADVPLV